MMTSSNGNIFRVTGPLCGEFTGPGEFPTQRPVTRSFDVFFDLRLNKRLSKQPWGWWFETLSWSLWRHCNAITVTSQQSHVVDLWFIQPPFQTDDKENIKALYYWCFVSGNYHRWIPSQRAGNTENIPMIWRRARGSVAYLQSSSGGVPTLNALPFTDWMAWAPILATRSCWRREDSA